MRKLLLPLVLAAATAWPFATDCQCEQSKPEMWKAPQCSLCREAELQPKYLDVFFLKDINPTKPNRVLALPRIHTSGVHTMSALSEKDRETLWSAAVTRAHELWGDQWALVLNSDDVRTQCHTHIHIGKMLPTAENDNFVWAETANDIPINPHGEGEWIHPVGQRLHVHIGGDKLEPLVLMR